MEGVDDFGGLKGHHSTGNSSSSSINSNSDINSNSNSNNSSSNSGGVNVRGIESKVESKKLMSVDDKKKRRLEKNR